MNYFYDPKCQSEIMDVLAFNETPPSRLLLILQSTRLESALKAFIEAMFFTVYETVVGEPAANTSVDIAFMLNTEHNDKVINTLKPISNDCRPVETFLEEILVYVDEYISQCWISEMQSGNVVLSTNILAQRLQLDGYIFNTKTRISLPAHIICRSDDGQERSDVIYNVALVVIKGLLPFHEAKLRDTEIYRAIAGIPSL